MSDNRDDFIIAIRYALLKKSAKQKFSLFFLILLSALIITLDKLSIAPINSSRALLNDFIYRVTVVVAIPGKSVAYLSSKTKQHINIYNENEILKKELELLKINKYNSLFLKTENENLKSTLDFETESIKGTYQKKIAARIMIDQESPFLKSLLINKGVKNGISKGMTVFSKEHLIGTVIETNYLSARVLLITDLNSKIPIIIQDTDVNAILEGNGDKDDFILSYLPENFILEPNKIIYTSGRDGFLKSGIALAQTFLDKNNKIKIKSLADPQQSSIVYITKGKILR